MRVTTEKKDNSEIKNGTLITFDLQETILLVIEVLPDKRYKCMAIKHSSCPYGEINTWSGDYWKPYSGKVILEQ